MSAPPLFLQAPQIEMCANLFELNSSCFGSPKGFPGAFNACIILNFTFSIPGDPRGSHVPSRGVSFRSPLRFRGLARGGRENVQVLEVGGPRRGTVDVGHRLRSTRKPDPDV